MHCVRVAWSGVCDLRYGSAVPDVDASEDEALSCSAHDFLCSQWGEEAVWCVVDEAFSKVHACALEPADVVDIIDMLELVVVAPDYALFPDRVGVVPLSREVLDGGIELALTREARQTPQSCSKWRAHGPSRDK